MSVNTSRRTINRSKKNVYKPTLDVQHNAFVSTIQEMASKREKLQVELKEVDRSIKEIETSMRETDMVDDGLVKRFTLLKDKKIDIQSELRKIDSDYNEQSYYTNTASILFEYYDLVEKGTSHTDIPRRHHTDVHPVALQVETPVACPTGPSPAQARPAKAPSILDYFKASPARVSNANSIIEPKAEAPVATSSTSTSISTPTSGIDANATTIAPRPCQGLPTASSTQSRGALLSKYMKYTDPDYIKNTMVQPIAEEDMCPHCGSSKVMIMTNDGYTWCTKCDAIEYVIIDHEKPSYRDPPKEISFFAYKRSNHLNEWISQIQGKETTEIPEEVYDKILMEIRKQRITNMAELTTKKIKSILKLLQINRYYEHSAHIINRLTGVPMRQLSPELEEQLRNMFKMIQTPFLKHAPKNRKNFLSYSYVLHKLVQLLGKDEYLDSFLLLKSREKLMAQDHVWRLICGELNWEFYPSL